MRDEKSETKKIRKIKLTQSYDEQVGRSDQMFHNKRTVNVYEPNGTYQCRFVWCL